MVSKNGWQVDVDALVQIDAVGYSESSVNDVDPGTKEPLNQESIYVRRALLRFQAHRDGVFANLELEADNAKGPVARLQGAFVGWSMPGATAKDPPLVTAAIGLMLIPFGTEVPTNVRDKTFLEAPRWAQAMFPGFYDGGLMVKGGFGLARWVVAVMSGAPSGDLQWAGRDPDDGYDFLGRIGAAIDLPHLYGRPKIDFGVSAITGTSVHEGTPPTKTSIQWVDDNNNGIVDPGEIQQVAGTPGQPSVPFTHSALGADASMRWCLQEAGAGMAWAELAYGTNLDRALLVADPVVLSRDVRELGMSFAVLQDLGPYAQVGVRYDRYNADRDAQIQAGVMNVHTNEIFSALDVIAAGRLGTSKLILEYGHRKNPLGLSDNGLPATRGDDRVVLRAEVKF